MKKEEITIGEAMTLLEERDTKEEINDLMQKIENVCAEIYYVDGAKFELDKIKGTNKKVILKHINEPFKFILKADIYAIKKDKDNYIYERIFSNYTDKKISFSTKRLPCFNKEKVTDTTILRKIKNIFEDSNFIYADGLFKYLKSKIKEEQRKYSIYSEKKKYFTYVDKNCGEIPKLKDLKTEIFNILIESGIPVNERIRLIDLIYHYGELKERRGRIKIVSELYRNLKGIFNIFKPN